MTIKLSTTEYHNYLQSNVIPNFQPLIKQQIHSYLINQNLQVEIGTDLTAQAFGTINGQQLNWLNFSNYSDEKFLQRLFKQSYTRYGKDWLIFNLKKIVYLQQLVFEQCIVIQFIDMLPYNNQYVSRMTTYTPILHPNGEVIAIQAATIETYILRFQGHIDNPNTSTYNSRC